MQTHIFPLDADPAQLERWGALFESVKVTPVVHQQVPERVRGDASQVWIVLGSTAQVQQFIGQTRAADSLAWVMAGLSDYSSDHACQCLDMGADCVGAPTWTDAEILAWWRRLCRRAGPAPVKSIEVGPLQVLFDEPAAYLHGNKLELGLKQVKLMRLLAKNVNALLAREAIHDVLNSDGRAASDTLVDVHIYRLRRLLAATDLSIETVRGEGYVLRTRTARPVAPAASPIRRSPHPLDILRNLGAGQLVLH